LQNVGQLAKAGSSLAYEHRTFDWPQSERTETAFLLRDEHLDFLNVPLPMNDAVGRDLLFDTGLRASELCRANVEDVQAVEDGKWGLAVTVKGRGTRRRPKSTAPASATRGRPSSTSS
jgi:integrase